MSIAILASALVLVLMLQLFYTVGEKMSVRNAADSAAISAAITLRDSGSAGMACQRAQEIVDAGEIHCDVAGELVTVRVRQDARFGWVVPHHEAVAVAGPATTD